MAEILSDAEIDAPVERGRDERERCAVPSSVRYDGSSGKIVVEFVNAAAFRVPARSVQDLAGASDEDLADVSLLGETGLHWQTLDVDFSIAGLMSGVFGTVAFMEMSRKGGLSKSPEKAAAALQNGARGGRPRKVS